MIYILYPFIVYDTETKDLRTSLLSDESREYLIKLLKINSNLEDLPETVNLQALIGNSNENETPKSSAPCPKEKEVLDNLTLFQKKRAEENQRYCLEMSAKHHNAEKNKLLQQQQQTQNKFKKLKNWTFGVLITSSMLLLGTAILGFIAPIFAGSFLIGSGWLVLLLAIPNALLIRASYLTSRQLDELQTEIYKTSDILDSIDLKLASNQANSPSKTQQIPRTISNSSLQNQTSETSHTETSSYKIGFGNLLAKATIHQTQETDESSTATLDQSETHKAQSYSPTP